MYLIMTLTMGIGSYVPVMFGATVVDPSTIICTVLGGIVGIVVYQKLRSYGYIE